MSFANRRPWIAKITKTDKGGEKITQLATAFAVEASVIAADRDNRRSLRIKFQDEELETYHIDIPTGASVTGGGRDLLCLLREQGVLMSKEGTEFIIETIRETQPPNAIRQFEFPGFHGSTFVTPGGEAINSDVPVELAPTKRQKGVTKSGSLSGWIAAACVAFPHFHFSLALCLAFVGVLIDLLKLDTMIIFFSGETSHGKSTGQRLGASAWGDTRIKMGQWISCRQTLNALEAHFERASGSYLGLDDGVHVDGKQMKEMVFMAHSGSGKGRLNQHADSKPTRGWRTVVTISDELGLVQKLRNENVSVSGGLTVRAMDIGFDDVELLEPERMASIEGAYDHTGHAGPEFARKVVALGYVDDTDKLRAEIDEITISICGANANSQQRRAAIIPSLVVKAGLIAKAAGLFPADADIESIGRQMWQRAAESELAPASNAERALNALRESLISRKGVDILNVDDDPHRQAKGWFLQNFDGHCDAYAVLVSTVSELSGGILTAKALGKVLANAGMLVPGGKGNARSYVPKVGVVNCYLIRASFIDDQQ